MNLCRFTLISILVILLGSALSALALDSADFTAIWLMDEDSGTDVSDFSGMGNLGTIHL